MAIEKAIIPAGGLGTRFLPATKMVPKEMLPILDKPAIQYIVEEGVRAGIKSFAIVTGKHKGLIEDYFDSYLDLENFLRQRNKEDSLDGLNKLIELANFMYIRQKDPMGLGHAVWSARHAIGNEQMAILLPDDIIINPVPVMVQLMQVALREKCNIIAVQEVPIEDVSRYGIIGIRKQFSPNLFQIKELVEKPTSAAAPSNLAIVGRYILSPRIFDVLEDASLGAGGEVQLTDAIQTLLLSGEKVFALKVQGERYDIGTPLGLLKANIDSALRHPKYASLITSYLQKLDKDLVVLQGQVEALKNIRPAVL